jgi:hypothetical protein
VAERELVEIGLQALVADRDRVRAGVEFGALGEPMPARKPAPPSSRRLRSGSVAATDQTIELRDFERGVTRDCRRIVGIGPDGAPASADVSTMVQPLIADPPEVPKSDSR